MTITKPNIDSEQIASVFKILSRSNEIEYTKLLIAEGESDYQKQFIAQRSVENWILGRPSKYTPTSIESVALDLLTTEPLEINFLRWSLLHLGERSLITGEFNKLEHLYKQLATNENILKDVAQTELASYYLANKQSDKAREILTLRNDSYWSKKFNVTAIAYLENYFHNSSITSYLKRGSQNPYSLSFSSVNKIGRFGHAMSEYHFVKSLANKCGLELQTPTWIGDYVFELDDVALSFPYYPKINANHRELSLLASISSLLLCNRDIHSPGSENCIDKSYIDSFRSIFTFRKEIHKFLSEMILSTMTYNSYIIAAHIRLTDQASRYKLPCFRWYIEWLKLQLEIHPKAVIYIASDDIKTCRDHLHDLPYTSASMLGIDEPLQWLFDFFVLTIANKVAISQSGFSINAAILNRTASEFYYPNFKYLTLSPFEQHNFNVDELLYNA